MPRLVNGERKITNPKPENAGKLLIFCEDHTEDNYLDYFKQYLDNNLHVKYSDIIIEPINAEGDAMHVYNYAEEFLNKDDNASKYLHYEKHWKAEGKDMAKDIVGMNPSVNIYKLVERLLDEIVYLCG